MVPWVPFPLRWTPKSMKSFKGKVAVVTGGTSGIGYEVARTLAAKGAHVVILSRDGAKGERTVQSILDQYPTSKVDSIQANLGDLRSVKHFVEKFKKMDLPLHLLINDAGVFHPGPFALTVDGFEQTMGVNYWGPMYLTLLLLDKLIATGGARIINVASAAEAVGWVNINNITGSSFTDSGLVPYGTSKLQVLMFSQVLQSKLRQSSTPWAVDVFCTHPGLVNSPLGQKMDTRTYFTALISYVAAKVVGVTTRIGATSTLYAAASPRLKGSGMKYYGPYYPLNLFHTTEIAPLNPNYYDASKRDHLFEGTLGVLEQKTGEKINRVWETPAPPGPASPEVPGDIAPHGVQAPGDVTPAAQVVHMQVKEKVPGVPVKTSDVVLSA